MLTNKIIFYLEKKEIETINQINFLEKDLKNFSKNEENFKKESEKNQEKIEDLKINFLKIYIKLFLASELL